MAKKYFTKNSEYWVYNEAEKPVIIMIHGFRGTHHGLELIAKDLPEYKVIIPDLPGFGETKPLSGEHSLNNYVIWLRDFIKDLKLQEPPILLGHSFGSIVVSHYAKDFPDSISNLILVNPIGAPALEGSKALFTKLAILYYWLGYKLPEPIASKLLSSNIVLNLITVVTTKTKDKEIKKYIKDQHLRHFNEFANRRVVNEAFKASVENNVRTVAPDIKTNTLIIAGALDDITLINKQYELQKLFKKAKITTIKNTGHLTHYEAPYQIANAIRNFMI